MTINHSIKRAVVVLPLLATVVTGCQTNSDTARTIGTVGGAVVGGVGRPQSDDGCIADHHTGY